MKPLEGITVVDFSRVLAGPSATQILAELGATVIKIERPGAGDESRSFEPKLPGGESAYFFAFNRGKHSITLDLKSKKGQQLALSLVSKADVLVENFLPGTLERMNLGYEACAELNPSLVYVSATGFGQTGPERQEKGYDTIFQALSGIMSMTGHPEGPPAKTGIPVADLTSGLWVVIAILTGLAGRSASGKGCFVDVAMMDIQISLLALAAARVFALDEDPVRTGTEHPGRVPSAAFECADRRWLHISGSDQHWAPLCQALKLSEFSDDRSLDRNSERVRQRSKVMHGLSAALSGMDRDEAIKRLKLAGVPVGEVRSVREALTADQAVARDIVQTFHHPLEGKVRALRTPLRLEGYDNPDVQVPPQLGADTDRILAEYLGLTEREISELHREGVV